MQVADTLAYLTGSWRLERTLADHRAGASGSFSGMGELVTTGRRGRYEERGQLRFGGAQSSAHRALDLVALPGGGVAVRFTDGRPFFELDLRDGSCRALHPCRLDRYELDFIVESPDRLIERWRVTGPAKDYEAETTWLRRQADET